MTADKGESYPWHGPVPQARSEEDLRSLRALLAPYNEASLGARLNLPNLMDYTARTEEQLAALPVADELDALIRLFFDCVYVREEALAPQTRSLLDRLGLIARAAERPDSVYGTVAIVLVAGETILCDRGGAPDGARVPMPEDVVYPPIFENTRHFLASLPDSPCEAMLDLGTGSGIAALTSGRRARQVWATDITARSVAFAELNCRFAGRGNITVLQGDLYAPVEGLTFDRIVIYPPYVPARRSQFVYRDGGEDGSAIIRRVVAGLPRFLRPGGSFHAALLAFDREGETFEQRVRGWLGETQGEFDVAFAMQSRQSTGDFLTGYLGKGPTNADDLQFWVEMWQATRTEAVLYGALTVARHAEARESATIRVHTGAGYTARRLEDLLAFETALHHSQAADLLLDSRPCRSPHCLLRTTNRIHEGRVVVEGLTIETSGPFRSALECDWWLAQALCQCDGTRTWRELMEWARDADLIPQTVTATQFAGVLATLVRKSMVECPVFAKPADAPLVQ